MNKLLAEVIDAHGGMDRWNTYGKVEASLVSGGGFFPLKGLIQDPDPRQMMAPVLPYGTVPKHRAIVGIGSAGGCERSSVAWLPAVVL
jgi:hypothetical protein